MLAIAGIVQSPGEETDCPADRDPWDEDRIHPREFARQEPDHQAHEDYRKEHHGQDLGPLSTYPSVFSFCIFRGLLVDRGVAPGSDGRCFLALGCWVCCYFHRRVGVFVGSVFCRICLL